MVPSLEDSMTKLEIINKALQKLGQQPTTNLNDTSNKVKVILAIYDSVRDVLQAQYRWTFCSSRAIIGKDTVNTPAFEWDFSFPLPADFLRLISIDGLTSKYEIEGKNILSNVGTTSVATISIGESVGITAATIDTKTFEDTFDTTGSYLFTFDGTDWKYGTDIITLADYGIAITGTPEADDTVTVSYNDTALKIKYLAIVTDDTKFPIAFANTLVIQLALDCCQSLTQSAGLYKQLVFDFKESISLAKKIDAIQRPPIQQTRSEWEGDGLL